MTLLRLTALVAGLMLSLGAAAQTPAKPAPAAAATAQKKPDPVPLAVADASRREARELGVLLQFSDRASSTVAQMRAQVVQAIAQRSGKSVPEASTIVDEILDARLQGR